VRRITFWLSLVFIFVVPWEDSITALGLGSLARVMGLLLAAFWLITVFIEGRFRKPHLFHFLVLLFVVWNVVSVFWTVDVTGSLERIQTYAQVFLFVLVFWEVFQKPDELMTGLQAYVFGAYVLVGGTIYTFLNGIVAVEFEGRYSAPGVNAVDMALMLIIAMPIAMHLVLASGRAKQNLVLKLLNLAYIPLAIFALALTGSRTSLLAIIPFGFYMALSPQIRLQRKILVAVGVLIALIALFPLIPESLIGRLGTLGSSIAGADIGGRVDIWREAIAILARHPVFGIGGGALDSTIGTAAHNTYVSVATETGVIGFVLFISLLGVALAQTMRLPASKSSLWLTIFMTWAIGVLSLSWEFRKVTWLVMIFVVLGCNLLTTEPEQAAVPISREIRKPLELHESDVKGKAA
jgi:O-antigen ligase